MVHTCVSDSNKIKPVISGVEKKLHHGSVYTMRRSLHEYDVHHGMGATMSLEFTTVTKI